MTAFYDLIFNEKNDWDKDILITNVKTYSLRDIHGKVEEFQNLLRSEGEIKGKKIAALIPDLPVYFSLLIAVNKLGGTFIPLSHQFRSDDLTKVLDLTRPNIIFTLNELRGAAFKELITEWVESESLQTTIFTFKEGEFKKSIIEGNEEPQTSKGIDVIACTSGSTGVPKGVMLKADSIAEWTKVLHSGLELKQKDRLFLTIPMTAPYGIGWLLTCFKNQVQMVIPESLDMPIIINLLKDFPCNKLTTTPSIFKGIYVFAKSISPDILNRFELVSLAGEQISEEFVSMINEFRGRLLNHYGLSEQGSLMFTSDIRSEVIEWSFGEGIQYKVNHVSADGVGELMIKTRYGYEGYYLDEVKTREAITGDGWFYTGDLVRTNKYDKLEMVGRKKQMIKKGGVQVIPGEVEQVISKHPKVLQSAVVGIPHDVYGEEIVAFIVSEDDLNMDSIFSFVRERIAGYKVPGKIIKIREMPIIQGKLDKVTLKTLASS